MTTSAAAISSECPVARREAGTKSNGSSEPKRDRGSQNDSVGQRESNDVKGDAVERQRKSPEQAERGRRQHDFRARQRVDGEQVGNRQEGDQPGQQEVGVANVEQPGVVPFPRAHQLHRRQNRAANQTGKQNEGKAAKRCGH